MMGMSRLVRAYWWLVFALGCGAVSPGADGGNWWTGGGVDSESASGEPGSADDRGENGEHAGSAGPAGEGSSTGSSGDGADEEMGEDDSASPVVFDLGVLPDAPAPCGDDSDGGDAEIKYSYIWIANSLEGTISKINTETMVEEGRYMSRPDQAGNPSRTSVSLTGNVVVANRTGGLTKVYADLADCIDHNGNGEIDTSNGPDDLRQWGVDECIAWHTPFSGYTSQRPVAWAQGYWNPNTCRYENEKVWTSGVKDDVIEVVLVDGETGVPEEVVSIPEVDPAYFGLYGAAVDANGNFWGSQLGLGNLVRVDRSTFDVDIWPMEVGGYGMTVDPDGYVWTCASQVGRFDPVTETWSTATPGGSGGCMADTNGLLWLANQTLKGINRETLEVEREIMLPEYVHGVSIDFHGYVWGVTMTTKAFRVDPTNGEHEKVDGLLGPYTYSDMTGFALKHAGSGGQPSG